MTSQQLVLFESSMILRDFCGSQSATTTEPPRQDQFLSDFNAVAEAPDGVSRLRELILDLAIRGKLAVSESVNSSGLNRVTQEAGGRERITHAGMPLPSNPLPVAGEGEAAFEIPDCWVWTRIEHICTDSFYGPRFGKAEYVTEGGVPTIRTTDMTPSGEILLQNPPHVRVPANKLALYRLQKGDLLVTRSGSIGTTAIFRDDFDAVPSAYLIRFRFSERVSADFVQLFLRSPFGQRLLGLGTTRVAQPNVSASTIRAMPCPLPPLAEQKLIVAKVDQLMALCDELEAKQAKQRALGDRLTKASLGALSSAEGPEELAAAWKRVAENFEELIDRPEAVSDARRSILDLAVRGGLRPRQLSADTAEEFSRALAEKKRNVTPRGGRRGRSFEPEGEAEPPFEAPSGWTWVRLDEIAAQVDYGTSDKPTDDSGGIPLLRMNNIQAGSVVFEPIKYVPRDADGIESLLLQPGDILFNRTNSYELVGKAAIYLGASAPHTFASYLIRVRTLFDLAGAEFLNYYLCSPVCRRSQVEPSIVQQNGQANFNGTKLRSMWVPLPPQAEIPYIVQRVRRLMKLCDDLEAKLRTRDEKAAKLAEALVAEIVG